MFRKASTHCYLFILSLACLFMTSYFFDEIDSEKIDTFADNYKIIFFSWVLLLVMSLLYQFAFCVSLMMKERWRESIFMVFTRSQVRDELEEKAVNDAIKRSFLLNISFLIFLFILSDVKVHVKIADKAEEVQEVTKVTIMMDAKRIKDEEKEYLIPKSFYGRKSIFAYLLLQLIIFRFFLYLNQRKLELI